MRRLIASTAMTLNGVMGSPEKWAIDFYNDEMGVYVRDELRDAGGLLIGRVTYEGFAEYWPTVTDETGMADLMNGLPKFVASTTLDEVGWDNASLLTGDAPDAVSRLKQEEGKDLLLLASAGLGSSLRKHDLIDELRIAVSPVVYGEGKRYFEEGESTSLDLVDTKTVSTGIVILTYEPRRD